MSKGLENEGVIFVPVKSTIQDRIQSLVSYPESIKKFEEVVHTAATPHDKVVAMVDWAHDLLDLKPERSVEILLKALKIAQEHGLPSYIGQCHLVLMSGFNRLGNMIKAIEHGEESLKYAKLIGVKNGEASSLNNLGSIYYDLGDYEKALRYFKESLAIKQTLERREQGYESGTIRSIGNIFLRYSEYSTALKYFIEALALSREADNRMEDNRIREANCLADIGEVFFRLGNITDAERHFISSLEIGRTYKNTNRIVQSLLLLGELALDSERLPESKKYIGEALFLARESGIMRSIMEALLLQGGLEEKAGNTTTALRYFEEVCENANKKYISDGLKAEYSIAKIQLGINPDSAVTQLKSIAKRSLDHGLKGLAIKAYQTLAMGLSKDEKTAMQAYNYLHEYLQLRETFMKEESDKLISLLRIEFELTEAKKETEIQRLLTMRLERELSLQATQLVTQTELLSKFRDELREIVRQSLSQDPTIRAIKEKLKELPCKQIDWEKFETEFKAVHPEFSRKLHEQFPSMTPTETKMCSLLRLNLKSHEIARLFCLSERSVETHRFNIRKKLGLDREKSLSMFLNSL